MNQTPEAERERALFEAQFAGKLDFYRLSPDCDYLYSETGYAWDGWQAARAIPQAAAEPVKFKDHNIRQLVNDLRDIALKFHSAGQLRDRISGAVQQFLQTPTAPDRAPSIDSATAPADFDAWWARQRTNNGGNTIGADYRHWARKGWEGRAVSPTERDAALEDAATVAENFGCNRPIVHPNPSQIVRGRWEGEQAASQNIASIIRGMKKSRAIAAMKGEGQ